MSEAGNGAVAKYTAIDCADGQYITRDASADVWVCRDAVTGPPWSPPCAHEVVSGAIGALTVVMLFLLARFLYRTGVDEGRRERETKR